MKENLLSIQEAANWLGVSRMTLRNWDKNGKLSAFRHPINNYRVYKLEDLENIVKQIESGESPFRQSRERKRKLTVLHIKD